MASKLLFVGAAILPAALSRVNVMNDISKFYGSSSGEKVNYAGYVSYSDITSHASIDCDQQALEDCYYTYADTDTDYRSSDLSYSTMFKCAQDIYESGSNAGTCNLKEDGGRTLKGFSTQAAEKFGPSVFQAPYFTAAEKFFSYYGMTNYSNTFVMDAIDGTGVWDGLTTCGYGGTKYNGTVDEARWQAVKKGTAYMNVPMYVLYEYFRRAHQAVNAAEVESLDKADKTYNMVHGWDEGWAFWAGAGGLDQEMVTEPPSSDGYLMYNLAEKRDGGFKTNTAKNPNGVSDSWVNSNILAASQIGRNQLINYENGTIDGSKVWQAYQCIENQVFIPNIQGCIQYAYKSDSSVYDCEDCGKEIGEMYTFCMAVMPLIHNASVSAAATILAEVEPANNLQPSYSTVRDALYPVLNSMGYKCSDIGVYEDDTTFSYASVCNDDAVPDHCGMAVPMDESIKSSSSSSSKGPSPMLMILGIVFFVLGLVACAVAGAMVNNNNKKKDVSVV